MREPPFKTWIELKKEAIIHNLKFFKARLGSKVKILCVLKANAYGHGLPETAKILRGQKDAAWFGVDNLREAMVIKKLGGKIPVLIMGYTQFSDLEKTILNDFSFVVYNKETLVKILTLKPKGVAKLHLKIETGLNRQGIQEANLSEILALIDEYPKYLRLEGVYTHFLDPDDKKFTLGQIDSFRKILSRIRKVVKYEFMSHVSATGGVFLYPYLEFDMARIGIGLYGLWPSTEINNTKLKPVLSWKSILAQTKTIRRGESVGYGRTWFAKKETKVAIIPVGYSDGFPRGLSNVGRVLVRGKICPIIGRVMMNMIVVNITGVREAKLEEEVVLIGCAGGNRITADDLAIKSGTINHEILSRINPGIPRVVV